MSNIKPIAKRLPGPTLAALRVWHTDRFGARPVEGPADAEPVIVTGRLDCEIPRYARTTTAGAP